MKTTFHRANRSISTIGAIRWTAQHVLSHPSNQGRRARQLAKAFAFQLTGRLLKQRKLVPIGNHSVMWADVHNGASFKVYCANPPDWREMRAWRKRLRPGDLFIDVGANVGSYTLWVAETGVRTIAIEPDAASRTLLMENIALNGYDVEVLSVALGAETGEMRLTSGLGANRLHLASDADISYQVVAVRTIDDLIGDAIVGGVKIDVEGAELLVLEGARKALSEHRIRCVQMEWNATSVTLLGQGRGPVADLLASYGYRLCRPDEDGNLRFVDEIVDEEDVFAMPM